MSISNASLLSRRDCSDMGLFNSGLVGYPSDDINKFLWMVRIGGGVFPHIKEPDYLVSFYFFSGMGTAGFCLLIAHEVSLQSLELRFLAVMNIHSGFLNFHHLSMCHGMISGLICIMASVSV